MRIREFREEDASFCFNIRSSAFVQIFYDEAGAEAASAGVNAYMPEDYINLSEDAKIFVVEDGDEQIGFVTVKKKTDEIAEIPLIYFDLKHLGKGFGSRTMLFIEDWVKDNWESVITLFLDTIIPEYNEGFYAKMGYTDVGDSTCPFPDKQVKAKRFMKTIK